jgi:hypothetical protein
MADPQGNAWEAERRKVAEIKSAASSALHGKPAADMPHLGLAVSRVKHLFPKHRNPCEVILLDVSGYGVKTRLVLNKSEAARLAKALQRALDQLRSARPTVSK